MLEKGGGGLRAGYGYGQVAKAKMRFCTPGSRIRWKALSVHMVRVRLTAAKGQDTAVWP